MKTSFAIKVDFLEKSHLNSELIDAFINSLNSIYLYHEVKPIGEYLHLRYTQVHVSEIIELRRRNFFQVEEIRAHVNDQLNQKLDQIDSLLNTLNSGQALKPIYKRKLQQMFNDKSIPNAIKKMNLQKTLLNKECRDILSNLEKNRKHQQVYLLRTTKGRELYIELAAKNKLLGFIDSLNT